MGLNELKNATFFDVDSEFLPFFQHTINHKEAWVRRSANKHFHAIVFDACPQCCNYGDEQFDGETLFNNKGKKWSSPIWKNEATGKTRSFKSVILIHIWDSNSHTHFYCEESFKDEMLQKLQLQSFHYFTFHSAIAKNLNIVNKGVQSNGDETNEKEYIEEFNFKQWKGRQNFDRILNDFFNHIPKEFLI